MGSRPGFGRTVVVVLCVLFIVPIVEFPKSKQERGSSREEMEMKGEGGGVLARVSAKCQQRRPMHVMLFGSFLLFFH